ncbi:metallophosphoesterase family protein [Lederbergia panacisoli]|uniref:metallophosphoesterase family protein n=1 Tax=Lederbergia panacisoli TaxID=1255251 RepID=UPI00214CE775|nr:metallophosphoesterase [Lederbergia panacisoli]MCR2823525.1 metallophosphoesterase [Lederbergia panacisoli]
MLRIALLGDLHYPVIDSSNKQLSAAVDHFFEDYLHEFLSIEADFHISIGDLTHLGLESEFLSVYKIINKFNRNFQTVLGNHDVLSLPKEKISSLIQLPTYHSLETEEYFLLFLDTTKEFELHGWGLDQEQWRWLEKQMEHSKEKHLLVFAHHPVPETTTISPKSEGLKEPLQDIRPLLKKRDGCVIYFNGHTHVRSYVQKNNFHFIQAGAAICDPDILLVELDGSNVNVRRMDIINKELEDSRKILYEKLPEFHRPKLFQS